MTKVISLSNISPLSYAFSMLPKNIQERALSDIVLAGNASWVHNYDSFRYQDINYDYTDNPHVAYTYHSFDKQTTLFLPKQEMTVDVCIHELAHVIHESLWFEDFDLDPCTEYAEHDYYECFAEAFTAYFFPNYGNLSKHSYQTIEHILRTS